HINGDLWTDVGVRLFTRKIGGLAFGRFYFHFFAGFDLDERLRRGLVLLVGFQPDGAPQHFGVVIHRHGGAWATIGLLALTDFVRVIQRVTPGAHGNFQPPIAAL